ncbi:hypothetical protein K505DRAFT_361488 [Melanomma pulvis-pyrius CBS 109.77]|uniref:HMG box domain-containing protein n=1 Tax=Melanomma pulvis-pyrius CBS 109.77 TaxID=1314802 RepID=A0A6A6XC04_9PLEO|nr:hypothetical protein K505DRAFT_361488 [Melanomma pulvis-pyrius CBS 109.77]
MAATPSLPIQTAVPVLADVLGRLGLSDYLETLDTNGFRDWETVVDITEEDLTALRFKLGHRRALQREIASYRGIHPMLSLIEPEGTLDTETPLSTSALESLSRETSTPGAREKRRYRRHPKADRNAPKKPKTAYVNFADQLRSEPDISCLSFIDIAKEVGRRWQILPLERKRIWESHAARALQEYEVQIDEYKQTDDWRKYRAYLSEFKANQPQTTPARRSNSGRVGSSVRGERSRRSPSSTESPASMPSSSSSGPEVELCHNALTLAFSELISLRGELTGQEVQLYDEHHLPAEGLVRRAMYAFVRGTGSLLFMWTYDQADEILNRIYRPEKPVDKMTLAECFTVAAMGAHYDMECCPDRIRRILYASGTLHIEENTARMDYLRTMRLLLSQSFYALLEKHLSARYLVAAGIQIARWKCRLPHPSRNDQAAEGWRRIFRSLLFMDCWLSYTLGYTSDVTAEDVAIACIIYRPELATIDELIHTQTSKIGLIAAEIAKTLASPEMVTRENIDMLNGKLETWRLEVPPMLQLPMLTSSNPPNLTLYQRRATLMIMYLGALILLYRHLLIATAETLLTDGAGWSLDLSDADARRYRSECAVAAQQIARILGLISFDGTLTKRCWLIIYWAFTACVALLFSATTKLLDGLPDTVSEDLSFAKACMDMLEPCRGHEPIADRYLNMVWPLYDTLRSIHQRILGRVKTSIFSLLEADPKLVTPPIPVSKEEMGPISEKLSLLLTDPFGRKQVSNDGRARRVLNQDGSCSVFWWK